MFNQLTNTMNQFNAKLDTVDQFLGTFNLNTNKAYSSASYMMFLGHLSFFVLGDMSLLARTTFFGLCMLQFLHTALTIKRLQNREYDYNVDYNVRAFEVHCYHFQNVLDELEMFDRSTMKHVKQLN